ncbi:MAG: 5-formyltetrahydrofolate cyclo-ligase [Sporomusaceae bacterium]|nr:5-formyltetrahydrofolate cyclo-ligase [Sporomusaceae bacterium]
MMLDKCTLRKNLLQIRRNISPEQRISVSQSIQQTLLEWPVFQQASVIMAYMAMKDEVLLKGVIDAAWQQGKCVAVPKMTAEPGVMEAISIQMDTKWQSAAFHIAEPVSGRLLDPKAIDLILLSGVAFDRKGNRLGMGGGYYDRFLKRADRAVTVAVTFDSQLVATIPVESYDHSVDYIATETGLFSCKL